MRDHSHISTENSDVCALCGQSLPVPVPTYGARGPNRTGLAITVLLHLLLLAAFLFKPPERTEKKAQPSRGGEIVYVAPLKGQPKAPPAEQAPKKTVKTPKPAPQRERAQVQRLPDTITLPDEKPEEKPVEVAKAEPQREPPPEMDMSAAIEARRRARGARTEQPAEESEEARGMRNALANVAALNNRGRDDRNESGGIFSIANKTFHSMDLKFRGWNPNFKRRWLTSVTVEQGSEPDLETAVIKKMIELIRREKTGDFEWDSHRLGRVVTMSARPQDTEQLQAFLFKEMFPDHKGAR